MYGLNRLDMTEDRISELENSSIKYTQFEQEMKKENNSVSGTSGTLTKELIFILLFLPNIRTNEEILLSPLIFNIVL